jgi:rSAM/selenodomain-associated transferase 2
LNTLSAIIPAFREVDRIERAVRAAAAIADEVIVVDGGSADGTAECAAAAGARVFTAPKGRGRQLHAGARVACGDTLLFLHADAWLPPSARAAIARALSDDAVAGGNFHLRFAPATPVARLFTWANDARRRWLRIYYGDSGLFVRRAVYERPGGFAPLPILEDYEFVRRLERCERTAYVRDVTVEVSARRFEHAPLRALGAWAAIHALYAAGVPAERLARLYRDTRERDPRRAGSVWRALP